MIYVGEFRANLVVYRFCKKPEIEPGQQNGTLSNQKMNYGKKKLWAVELVDWGKIHLQFTDETSTDF